MLILYVWRGLQKTQPVVSLSVVSCRLRPDARLQRTVGPSGYRHGRCHRSCLSLFNCCRIAEVMTWMFLAKLGQSGRDIGRAYTPCNSMQIENRCRSGRSGGVLDLLALVMRSPHGSDPRADPQDWKTSGAPAPNPMVHHGLSWFMVYFDTKLVLVCNCALGCINIYIYYTLFLAKAKAKATCFCSKTDSSTSSTSATGERCHHERQICLSSGGCAGDMTARAWRRGIWRSDLPRLSEYIEK